MIRKYVPVFLLSAVSLFLYAGDIRDSVIELDSVVSEVTVFSDRAMVSRSAEFAVPSGEKTLRFYGLPRGIDSASIQVSGTGSFVLRDVKVGSVQTSRVASERLQEMYDEKTALERELKKGQDTISEANSEKAFIHSIATFLTSDNAEAERTLDPAKWMEMVGFYRMKLSELNEELRTTNIAVQDIRAEIDRVNREISAIGSEGDKAVLVADLLVEGNTGVSGRGKVKLSYLVYGASWRPDYVLRVDGAASRISFAYQAFVRQSTGEDWLNARLSLSTARPQAGGSSPVISPWFVDVYKPVPAPRAFRQMDKASAPEQEMDYAENAYETLKEEAPMTFATGTVEEGTASVVFAMPGTQSVLSDNQEHRVTIGMFDFPAEFEYKAVPRLSPYAYLRGTMTNESGYPFLSGTSHVYLDGSYVADASIALTAPGEKIRVDLGVDEAIAVEHRDLGVKTGTSGIFSKKTVKTFEYILVLTNNKKSAVTITVQDQIPVTLSSEISVKLVDPVIKDEANVTMDDQNILEWKADMRPGQVLELPLEFTVEYPEGLSVGGL